MAANCATAGSGLLCSEKEPAVCQYTQQHGRVSQALCQLKEAGLKGGILYDSIYVTFQKRQNCRDQGQISDCQGLSLSRRLHHRGAATENFSQVIALISVLIVVVVI